MSQQQLTHMLKLHDAVHPITLDCRRSVYLAESKTLLIADLHWGKSRIFQQHGIPITEAVLTADLDRLSALIKHFAPDRLLALGDLIHGARGLTDAFVNIMAQWRQQYPVPMTLVEGNHDKAMKKVAGHWQIALSDTFTEGAFLFSHIPEERPGYFNWCGHVHPTVFLSSRMDSIRLPCFHLTRQQGLLPAFSYFTGGYNIQPQTGDQIIVVGDDFLLQI